MGISFYMFVEQNKENKMELTPAVLEKAMRDLTENYHDTLPDLFDRITLVLGAKQISGKDFLKTQQFLTYYFLWEVANESVGDIYKYLAHKFPASNPMPTGNK